MSLKKEAEVKNKITLKGTVLSIQDGKMAVEDEKSSDIDVLSLDDLSMFIGKSINLTVCDSVKYDITDNVEGEEPEDVDDTEEE